jgi:hypothetical protein
LQPHAAGGRIDAVAAPTRQEAREQETHHLAVETELGNLRLRHSSGKIDDAAAVDEMIRISREYSAKMPMAGGAPVT